MCVWCPVFILNVPAFGFDAQCPLFDTYVYVCFVQSLKLKLGSGMRYDRRVNMSCWNVDTCRDVDLISVADTRTNNIKR